jgi:hypothetical protein
MESVIVEEVMENFILSTKEKRQHFKDQALSRTGETRLNNLGSMMIVDEYNSSSDIFVRFEKGNMVHATWQQFLSGKVKNVYDRSVFGMGYIGEGKYRVTVNGEFTAEYMSWASMLKRAYSKKFHEKQPTYKDCKVCDAWLNFQNYAEWYDKNYYEIDGYRTDLDKDILQKGNKVYSPDTCVFVPQFINTLFLKRESQRGSLPIGVKICSNNKKKFEAQCRNNTGKRIYLGLYDTPKEAFQSYKTFKENLIKDTAKEYKGGIPNTLYNAMVTYKVEIND